MPKAAGIFLHPTSLPSRFGIGDFGDNAHRWIDLLAENKQRFWQVCPLGPTGYGDSPYQSLCSFAGNPLLISPELLAGDGLLTAKELDEFPRLPEDAVDYGSVIVEKDLLLRKAFSRFSSTPEFDEFCQSERLWLDDFALFSVIKERHGSRSWNEWESQFKLRFPDALDRLREVENVSITYRKFLQFEFFRQWKRIREHAREQGVKIIGDMPYYVAGDSADTWGAPHLFELDEKGNQLRLSGVPPDYFSETGQLWGNPLYRWEIMKRDGYAWWIRRIAKSLELFDYLRLDHFRGFDSYWAVPAGHTTAVEGVWEEGPGRDFFDAIAGALGPVPLVAEDLGDITIRVEELRRAVKLPGMKVLQFAFDGNPDNEHLPSNTTPDSLMYTGTHDNDTSMGWFDSLPERDRSYVLHYLGCTRASFLDRFMRLAYMAPSRLCIIPLQDVLGLPTECRMNLPGKESGNWRWRMLPEHFDSAHFARAAAFTEIYGRAAGPDFVL